MDENRGTLYIVATPIGNSKDMSPRGTRILNEVDIIAAEDTRRSMVLLNMLGVKNKLVSNHKFNEHGKASYFINEMLSGKSVAVITDAGTPCISDPGNELIKAAVEAGIKVSGIPGCCAAVTALSVSGFDLSSFMFLGFFPRENAERKKLLEKNPIDKIPRFKCQKKHMPAFTNLEMEKLFDNCTSTRDRALLEFLYSTGCRVQECVNMDIDDINFKDQTCLIRQGKGNKDRLVYISDKCMYWLEKYLKERKDNDKALWLGKRGRLSKRGIEVLIQRIGNRAGVHAYPHKFRHTLATNMVRRGAPLPAVQQILGHEEIGTTMVYVDVNKQTAENAHRQSVI